MITHPLDLASRLRPPPRNFDAWFYVNAGVLAVFFVAFGSRFILAPGLAVDFVLPQIDGARAGAAVTTHFITVLPSGQIYDDNGQVTVAQLGAWLQGEARKTAHPSLLVKASASVTTAQLAEIASAAHAAGFHVILAAEEPAGSPGR
jgi:biopolymer transport protein ExbD